MKRPPKQISATLNRIETAAGPGLRRGGRLLVLASLIWPFQAAAAAWSVAGWAQGQAGDLLWLIVVFVLAGGARAFLEARAGGRLFQVADTVVADERQTLLAREARRSEQAISSAELAVIVAQKLPLVVPYLTRFRPAMIRVRVVPLVLLGLTFWISWVVGLVLLVAGPLIPVFMAVIGIAARAASDRQMVEIGDMNRLLMDRLSALADIRLLDATDRAEADFAERADGLRYRTMAVLRVAFLSSTVLELLSAVAVAIVAVYVGFSLLGTFEFGAWDSGLSLFEGIFLLLIVPEFFQPLRDLAVAWHDRAGALSVVAELDALEQNTAVMVPGQGQKIKALTGLATLRTQGAQVARGDHIVSMPDLDAHPGEAIALTGASGAGKTSGLMALAGLMPVVGGKIEVAGVTLTDQTADAWRARVAYIPQHVHMPDTSLQEFLDPDAAGGDIGAALKAARAEGIVAALPEGLQTRLGETGAGVSGGEARRLLVARAILRGADVVLADEPTADLDPDTTLHLVETLLALAQQGTVVIVASHDPQVVDRMDRQIRVEVAA